MSPYRIRYSVDRQAYELRCLERLVKRFRRGTSLRFVAVQLERLHEFWFRGRG